MRGLGPLCDGSGDEAQARDLGGDGARRLACRTGPLRLGGRRRQAEPCRHARTLAWRSSSWAGGAACPPARGGGEKGLRIAGRGRRRPQARASGALARRRCRARPQATCERPQAGKKRNGRKRPAAGAPAVATKPRREARASAQTTATTGYETELWAAANTLRGNMDAAEYKHVVLGLIFLKYISDAFEERHAQLVAERDEARILKSRTNTLAQTCSGCRRRRVGTPCKRRPSSHTLAGPWTTR